MAKLKKNGDTNGSNEFRFNLTGLIVFSLCLIGGTALIGKALFHQPKPYSFANRVIPGDDPDDKSVYTHVGPWGELLVRSIQLERPAEYVATDISNPQQRMWTFRGMTRAQVTAFFTGHGIAKGAAEGELSRAAESSNGTEFTPDDDFICSLSPQTRQSFYSAMFGMGVNFYLDYPYIFSQDTLKTIYADSRLNPDDVAVLKKLVYRNGEAMHLSDYSALLDKIPTDERRIQLSRALSRQSAALASLCVRPDTDIDKIAAYWGHIPNVRFADIRPLLESLKAMPHGGTISLLYFLPPFARERLYTYPVPQANDPTMDCHWTTFNFSSVTPDNRFNDADYTVHFIKDNYYQIGAPTIYGDIVLLMNDKAEIKHSAVYLADDLVFTKYGNNYTQPWMITRIADMQAVYPTLKPVYFRKKTE